MRARKHATYGLIGEKLSHSWSPFIHRELGLNDYELIELGVDELEGFIRGGKWQGLNVTIPYKQRVLEFVDELSESVEAIRASNLLLRRGDGTIFADNSDVLGFEYAFSRFIEQNFDVPVCTFLQEKEVLILGSGGASKAVDYVVRKLSAVPTIISRASDHNYENLSKLHPGAAVVINTTPVGMYPNTDASPLSDEHLNAMESLEAVYDLIYNPLNTRLIEAAASRGIPAENGLLMLVAQAFYASKLFQNKKLDEAQIDNIFQLLEKKSSNIVLIGMPGAGKTSAGKRLARLLSMPFIDLDAQFDLEYGKSPAACIEQDSVDVFRKLESQLASRYGKESGFVIACGGGIVCREENYHALHQNGRIVLIDRPLSELSVEGRPLSRDNGVEKLAEERMWLYKSWADITISCQGSAAADADLIRDILTAP